MKNIEKQKARELRRQGLAIPKIAQMVGCTKGTISLWVRDIPLTSEQIDILQTRDRRNWHEARRRLGDLARRVREESFERGRQLVKTDLLFRTVCSLYWGEGSKMNNKNSFCIANADPALLRMILKYLKTDPENYNNVKLRIHYHRENLKEARLTLQKIKRFWLQALDLKEKNMQGTGFTESSNNRSSKNKRVGYQPFGTAHITVHRTALLQKVFGGIEGLKEECL